MKKTEPETIDDRPILIVSIAMGLVAALGIAEWSYTYGKPVKKDKK